MQGVIHLNDTLLLGPMSTGEFNPVSIRGIHRKRLPVKEVKGGQTASFALKKVREGGREGGNYGRKDGRMDGRKDGLWLLCSFLAHYSSSATWIGHVYCCDSNPIPAIIIMYAVVNIRSVHRHCHNLVRL